MDSRSYELPFGNGVNMSLDLEKNLLEENREQAGFSDCSEEVISAYLARCWKAGRLQLARLMECQKGFVD